ncbi:Uncharacterized protein Fot_35689 [Forsythia ovata]|uniref:Uncharacterized protein n=1 Tax=Forsythia ovata TaxID=205694 RepID=A0ABD1SMY0_9LAMI
MEAGYKNDSNQNYPWKSSQEASTTKCEEINSNLNIVLEELTDEVRVRSAKMEEIAAVKVDMINKCEELHVRIEVHKRRVNEFEREYRDAWNRQLLGTQIGYLTETID